MRGSEFAELRAFAEVAARGSFARAAESLRVSPSTLSQTIRALEDRLGISLLTRTTRRVALTGADARLLDRFAPAMVEMEAAVRDARESNQKPQGLVRFHLPRAAYMMHVEPVLGRLAQVLPKVVLDLTVDDSFGDFVGDGFDLFVRHADSIDSGMTAVALGGDLRHVVVASPKYLSHNGRPCEPAQLLEHQCINWRRPETREPYRWRFNKHGELTTLAVSGPIIVSHCDVAIAAAATGVGIAYVLEPLAVRAINDGRLVQLLDTYLPPFEGWKLCYPRQGRTPASVLAVVSMLTTV